MEELEEEFAESFTITITNEDFEAAGIEPPKTQDELENIISSFEEGMQEFVHQELRDAADYIRAEA